jgi:hypothetical protein
MTCRPVSGAAFLTYLRRTAQLDGAHRLAAPILPCSVASHHMTVGWRRT